MSTKHKKQKLELVFDPKERENFLTGFSKRKQARKKVARMNAEKQYKEEVQRIKKAKRDKIQQRLEEISSVKQANGIELTKLAEDVNQQKTVLDLPHHTVTITCAEEMDLSKCSDSAYLGSNKDTDAVEVVDAAEITEDDEHAKDESEIKKIPNPQDKMKKSTTHLAQLAKKAHLQKSKRKKAKVREIGRMSKSQKKFLKRKQKQKSRSR